MVHKPFFYFYPNSGLSRHEDIILSFYIFLMLKKEENVNVPSFSTSIFFVSQPDMFLTAKELYCCPVNNEHYFFITISAGTRDYNL